MDRVSSTRWSSNRPGTQKAPGSQPLIYPQSVGIRTAAAGDLTYVDHLQKQHADAVGFLPKVALQSVINDQYITLGLQNDCPAGYLLSRTRLRWQPLMRSITQTCVDMSAQRRHIGLALLTELEQRARTDGILAVQACCAVGLDSNSFWRAAGYIPIVHMRPDNVRGREIICWRKPLTSTVPIWFAMPPRYAGHRAKPPTLTRDPHRSTDALCIASRFTTPQARTQG